jgi:hypothetical protein
MSSRSLCAEGIIAKFTAAAMIRLVEQSGNGSSRRCPRSLARNPSSAKKANLGRLLREKLIAGTVRSSYGARVRGGPDRTVSPSLNFLPLVIIHAAAASSERRARQTPWLILRAVSFGTS